MSYYSTNSLRLPPFGRILDAYCQEKVKFPYQIDIYVGKDAKEIAYKAKNWAMCSYLPHGDDFKSYRWPIENQHVIIYDLDNKTPQFAQQFAYYLILFKPTTISIFSEQFPLKTYKGTGVIRHGRN